MGRLHPLVEQDMMVKGGDGRRRRIDSGLLNRSRGNSLTDNISFACRGGVWKIAR
jgi:hypothetical protein